MQFKRSSLPESALLYRFDPHVRQVLQRLPQSVVAKLSEEELLALYKTMAGRRNKATEKQLALPFLPKRFYCVTKLGLNRRAQTRAANSKGWSSATLGMALSMGLFAGLTLSMTGYRLTQGQEVAMAGELRASELSASELSASEMMLREVSATEMKVHPTALPWIEEEADCKGKSRQWKEGLCYEQDHDPQF